MATIQKMKTCDGKDTNIFTGLLYNIMNQNYGDGYGNQNYLDHSNSHSYVKISQISANSNWYFQPIEGSNYYNILNQNHGNQNYLTAVGEEDIVITTHSVDATNVWCIEPESNGAYYGIRVFSDDGPAYYLNYNDEDRSAGIAYHYKSTSNWHFEVVKDPLKFDFAVSEIRMQPVKDDDIRLTSEQFDSSIMSNQNSYSITQKVSFAPKAVTNTQSIDFRDGMTMSWINWMNWMPYVKLSIPDNIGEAWKGVKILPAVYEGTGDRAQLNSDSKVNGEVSNQSVEVPANSCVKVDAFFYLYSGDHVPCTVQVIVTKANTLVGYDGLVQAQDITDKDVLINMLSLAGNTEKILNTDPLTVEITGMMYFRYASGETFITSQAVQCPTTPLGEDSTTTPVHDDL
jgi:hypothetical protein